MSNFNLNAVIGKIDGVVFGKSSFEDNFSAKEQAAFDAMSQLDSIFDAFEEVHFSARKSDLDAISYDARAELLKCLDACFDKMNRIYKDAEDAIAKISDI